MPIYMANNYLYKNLFTECGGWFMLKDVDNKGVVVCVYTMGKWCSQYTVQLLH